jgi:bifunctional non-homologous end joining protein LigD
MSRAPRSPSRAEEGKPAFARTTSHTSAAAAISAALHGENAAEAASVAATASCPFGRQAISLPPERCRPRARQRDDPAAGVACVDKRRLQRGALAIPSVRSVNPASPAAEHTEPVGAVRLFGVAAKRSERPALRFPRELETSKRGQHWYAQLDGVEVRLSNWTKTYWPDEGYTKGDLLTAYYNLAPLILPHLRDRPLTLLRMPDGIAGPEFYEKQAPSHTPDWVPRAHVVGLSTKRPIDFLLANNTAALLFVASLGCIEMHPLHSRADSIERPDYAFFDLDPFPPITFETVRRVATMVKVALEQLGLKGYPKTSGATGMQVYVPLDGSHTYGEARAFVERVCRLINKTWPEGTTMEWEIAKRSGKVFLDYAMVSEGRNIGSVYSVRAKPGAPVSTPLRWEELDDDVEPGDFTIATVWSRYEQVGDLFTKVLDGGTKKGQNLLKAMDALGIDRSKLEPAPDARSAPAPEEPLKEYKRKRDFAITKEPAGALGEAATEQPTFMIHKHHARRLHYDLRLERGGVLVSFAVPKGLPEEPGVRRLAVHVEDHPMEYGTFEGSIPKGEYGAGEVRIFDEGTYEPLEWTEKKITIRLNGERLQGEYHLVNTDGKNWLIFRSTRAGALAAKPMPPVLQPMLATPGGKPFDDPKWLFEVKWDGVRTLAYLGGGRTRLVSRRGRDVNEQYPELVEMHELLAGDNALVDGEIVVLEGGTKPSFERMQQRFTLAKPTKQVLAANPVLFIAFDLLWLDGVSLVERPVEERIETLKRVLVPGPRVQHSVTIEHKGKALFEQVKARGLEGVIAKRKGSAYKPGRRTKDWVKVKAVNRQDCVIVGWSPGEGRRGTSLGALLVGVYKDGELLYAGHVGTGFTERTLEALKAKLEPLESSEPAIPVPPKEEVDVRGVHWVRPELVCEVEYLEFTSQFRMRAASFKGMRDDKAPEDCIYEG